jgi:hypothetical protein
VSVRVAHALLGVLVAVVWLVLPGMTISRGTPVAISPDRPVAGAAAQDERDETSATDLVLPLLVVGAAGVLAAYGFVRRTRRARGRTTPGGSPSRPAEPPLAELDERARALLVDADDWVRASRAELGFAEARFGAEDVEPFARAVRDAEAELAAAFRMRKRYEDGVPEDDAARRHVLAGIVGRCQEAGRLLDAQAAAFDQLRGLEGSPGAGPGGALEVAEARFRELAGRTGSADATLAGLAERYGPASTAAVAGHVEQAKDRLVFATSRLNEARQSADAGETGRAARHLRSAEAAIAQAATFIDGIDRLAGELNESAAMVPAALTGGEAELAGARAWLAGTGVEVGVAPGEAAVRRADAGPSASAVGPTASDAAAQGLGGGAGARGRGGTPGAREAGGGPDPRATGRKPQLQGGAPAVPPVPVVVDVPPGELRARVVHGDFVLAGVREEVTAGPYDPLDVLRRVVRAVAPVAVGRAGVVPAAASLTARSAVAGADDVVATHRGAVGSEARTLLAEARRLLTPPVSAPPGREARPGLADLIASDTLAQQARDLAEQDVRLRGNPLGAPDDHTRGLAGAVLGGVLPSGTPDAGPPAGFGGPHARTRRTAPPT